MLIRCQRRTLRLLKTILQIWFRKPSSICRRSQEKSLIEIRLSSVNSIEARLKANSRQWKLSANSLKATSQFLHNCLSLTQLTNNLCMDASWLIISTADGTEWLQQVMEQTTKRDPTKLKTSDPTTMTKTSNWKNFTRNVYKDKAISDQNKKLNLVALNMQS